MLTFPDLDKLRDRYDELSFQEFRSWCQQIAATWPEQAYWDAPAVSRFLDFTQADDVVELGGWDGALAQAVMRPGMDWLNLEVTEVPQVCTFPDFHLKVLEDWPWTWDDWGDVLIMSHVIEHMSVEHLRSLLRRCESRAVYVDAPLSEESGTNWRGSPTSHILPLSFIEVDALFFEHGFDRIHTEYTPAANVGSTIRWYA